MGSRVAFWEREQELEEMAGTLGRDWTLGQEDVNCHTH